MNEPKCNMFENAVSDVRCDKRYINLSIPNNVLNWAANDYFGVSTENLMKSPTFTSVLNSYIGCEYNSGEIIIGNNKYNANLENMFRTQI